MNELVSTRVWSSPFEAEGAQSWFVEVDNDGLAIEVGVSGEALRVFIEEEPGEPWQGPLTIEVDGVEVAWEEATTPRSVPNKTLYEASFASMPAGELVFVDGPAAGVVVDLPGASSTPWALGLLPLVAIWALYFWRSRNSRSTLA
jgi:hypothetical protein